MLVGGGLLSTKRGEAGDRESGSWTKHKRAHGRVCGKAGQVGEAAKDPFCSSCAQKPGWGCGELRVIEKGSGQQFSVNRPFSLDLALLASCYSRAAVQRLQGLLLGHQPCEHTQGQKKAAVTSFAGCSAIDHPQQT